MGAAQPINPLDVINVEEMDAQIYYLETYFTGTAAAVAAGGGAVAAGGVMLVFTAGALLTYDLLGNKQWNHFWVGVGGRLNDVWHKASDFLFGGHGVSLDTVGQMIQLAQHISMRASRQLITNAMGRIMVAQAGLIANMRRLAVAINHNVLTTQGLVNNARRYAHDVAGAVEARAIQREAARAVQMVHYVNAAVAADYQHVLTGVWKPLQQEIITLNGELKDLQKQVTAQKSLINGDLIPKVLAASVASGIAIKIATAAKAWQDDCGEPMCAVQGPKTDWGKLFKRFGPKALYVLLAAVAAADPQAVEGVAKEFADTFGPTLSHWTENWIGLVGGDRSADERKVGAGVGTISIFG